MVRFSVELPEEVAEALARAAAELQSTPEGVAADAVRSFLVAREEADDGGFEAFMADRDAFEAWIAEGEADLAAGRVHSLDEVMDGLREIIEAAKARQPK
jgi:predicted transcriptional regulator